jgi:uncharacterized RmlC-like cupin family protein
MVVDRLAERAEDDPLLRQLFTVGGRHRHNAAVASDGTFIYVPKGVRCPMELSTYFRINAEKTVIARHHGPQILFHQFRMVVDRLAERAEDDPLLRQLSDGTFIYVPKGVRCPMELSTYFRINAEKTGQFERGKEVVIARHHGPQILFHQFRMVVDRLAERAEDAWCRAMTTSLPR